ncbi:MAG: hypothetical protein ACRDGM_13860 [bacterium]
MTGEELLDRLARRHEAKNWVFFVEFRIGTGYGKDAEQRVDAWAIDLYPSHRMERVAYEVKVTREDFLREIKNPEKRRAALRLSNKFWFVAPPGIVKPEEVPLDCGLLESSELPRHYTGFVETVRAPWRDTPAPTWRLICGCCASCATGGSERQRRCRQVNYPALKSGAFDLEV